MNCSKIFNEITKHLIEDEKPSIYLNKIYNEGKLDEFPFIMLKKLSGVEQSPIYHPEGNVWIHSLMVVDKGVEFRDLSKDKKVYMWSLLLHDLGKLKATKLRRGRWTSRNHDKIGEEETKKFLNEMTNDKDFIYKVSKLVRYHMYSLYITRNMPYDDIEGMIKYTDLEELALVFEADRFGRGGLSEEDKKNLKKDLRTFREKYIDK